MRTTALIVSLFLFASTTAVHAADSIEGDWLTSNGQTAAIAACDAGFCITLMTGPNAGKQIGQVAAISAGRYEGRFANPESGRSVGAKLVVRDGDLTLTGCLNALMCQSQDWTRL